MLIAIAVISTLIEAVFTAMEIAIGAVSRSRLRAVVEADRAMVESEEDEDEHSPVDNGALRRNAQRHEAARELEPARRRARRLLRLLERPERLTLMFIIVTSLSLWTAATALTWHSFIHDWPLWQLVLTLVLALFVAEVLPLLLAAHQTESVALHGARLAATALTMLSPLMLLLGGTGHGLARLMGAGPNATAQVTQDELRTALATAEEEGVIESEERAMLEGAMDFRETRVREVMTPRIDMVASPASASLPEVLQTALHEGHSRLPIYEGTPDNIVGIVSTKDLIPHLRRDVNMAPVDANRVLDGNLVANNDLRARDLARPALFVPQDKRIAPTLEDLRRQRTLMAIVMDENGGTAGLVTLEDLLEEIVGEIQDEYDEEEPAMQVVAQPARSEATGRSEPDAADGTPVEPVAPSVAPQDGAEQQTVMAPAILCDGGVSVRDAQRFWRRSFNETIVLHNASGEPIDGALSLAALSLQLFGAVPEVGSRVAAGVVAPGAMNASNSAANHAAANHAASSGTASSAATSGTPSDAAGADGARVDGAKSDGSSMAVVELEVVEMNRSRIEKVKLGKAHRVLDVPLSRKERES
ncbi:MAG TPA: CNNM domain-containing protein [Abditibacteriaceae bacterium]|jgi:CBS domain containing-hemolysin-like protein